ncbi:expressed unknown protein [Seminavis robusta]|uniref:Uncharacterized protein n=1 Tax=Seminavis robusta TaxID=568900 RepID=A0A9N8H861_9STRA|nr:expressed unknown protein [Seminavis robusta]|eukprot:Sro228_g092610.1 n/a (147) ;mRNA; f:28536-28976
MPGNSNNGTNQTNAIDAAATNNNEGSTSTTTKKRPREQDLLNGLKRLDDEYQELWKQQRVLVQTLEQLETDEQALMESLVKVEQASGRPLQKNKDAQALERLQQALMNAAASSDDDDSDDSDDDSDLEEDLLLMGSMQQATKIFYD